MSSQNDTPIQSTPIRVKIANFLQRHRNILIIAILLVVVILSAVGIYAAITASTNNEYAVKVERVQQDLAKWQSETDDVKKKDFAATIEKNLADVIGHAPSSYGLLKAYFIQGNYQAAQKKWAEASTSFAKIFEIDSKSYLAPSALVNQAACLENAGNVKAALEVLANYEKNYASDKLNYPEVLFNQGRLLELQNDNPKAVAEYKKLLEKFPESNWAKLGRDRLIVIE